MGDLYPDDFDETQEQANEITSITNEIVFKTKLNFLKAHNGIRKKKMHFMIAPTHAGKSTLTRTVIKDLVYNNLDKRILIILSEETKKEFKESFYLGVETGNHLKNLKVSSQVGVTTDREKIKKEIQQMVTHWDIDIVVFDNLTTSSGLYLDESVKVQSETITWLKNLCLHTTVFVIAHTNTSDFNNRLLDEQDVRGGKSAMNITQFLYIMQPVQINDSLLQFILIKKHRGQQIKHKFYKLNYDARTMSFKDDYPVDFGMIKDVFKQRNKL